jgi:hypothetical protein
MAMPVPNAIRFIIGWTESEVVLNVNAHEVIAIVFKLSSALRESKVAAVIRKFPGQKVGSRRQAEFGGLEKPIQQIYFTALVDATKFQIVFSSHPADIIGKRQIVSNETCLRIVTKIKEAVDTDLLNRFLR